MKMEPTEAVTASVVNMEVITINDTNDWSMHYVQTYHY